MPEPASDLVLRARQVVTPEGIRPAAVHVGDGRILAITGLDAMSDTSPHPGQDLPEVVELDDHLVLLPGLVDSHVHVNEPGRTRWEGFFTATRAAAAGGITTIVDMPLNCIPPTTDVAALRAKRDAAEGQLHVDVAVWGGAVPGNDDELPALHAAGVRGFKAFLCDSGVPEYGCVHPTDVAPLVQRIADLGSTLIVHAEDPDICADAAATLDLRNPRSHDSWLDSRPPEAEVAAVRALVAAARETGGRVHVLHLSAADAGEVIADARAEGLAITVETCPHYLTIHAEDIPDGATEFKCAPPIRGRANADRLWDLLADGIIDAVVSDHSPCPPEDKAPDTGDFMAAWGGIASLQIGLPLVWTAARDRGHDLTDVVRWMAAAPARIAGLQDRGLIAAGARADLVAFDPDAKWTVEGTALEHRHPVTPHQGRVVAGAVDTTWLAGTPIFRDGTHLGPPRGRMR